MERIPMAQVLLVGPAKVQERALSHFLDELIAGLGRYGFAIARFRRFRRHWRARELPAEGWRADVMENTLRLGPIQAENTFWIELADGGELSMLLLYNEVSRCVRVLADVGLEKRQRLFTLGREIALECGTG